MRLAQIGLVVAVIAGTQVRAHAECKCLSVAAEVAAGVQADVLQADNLYAKGQFDAALALYTKAYERSKDNVLIYAQAMVDWQLGANDKARALFDRYLHVDGQLAYRDRASKALGELGGAVTGTVGAVGGIAGGVVGGVGGAVGGATGAALDVSGRASADVGGELHGRLDKPEPPKVGHTAGIILGVIAVAAVATVGIHSIAAGVSDNIDLDAKFDLGLGLTGVAVGATAFYVAGLGAATATAGSLHCASRTSTPIVAPIAVRGGGGIAGVISF